METVTAGKPFATLRAAQGKGDQGPMAQSGLCSRTDCSRRGVTLLGEGKLCFEHFCSGCYELLEQAERVMLHPSLGTVGCAELAERLDECARRALEISLSQFELSNLDRARLLDIVLWSGDLTSILRRKRGASSKVGGELQRREVLRGTTGNGPLN